jgi:hypothetical protein
MRSQTICSYAPKRCVSILGLAVAATTLGTSRASAQGTVLYGCYVPSSGTVYRIKDTGLPDACRSPQHVQFTWSLQGPAGPAGPAGPTGPQGPAGPAGGVPRTGVTFVVAPTPDPIPPGQTRTAGAVCPAGHVATGGGGGSPNSAATLRLTRSSPVSISGVVAAWQVSFENASAFAAIGEAYVVCVPAQ